jgi:diacylglycerol kinase (ATP)
LLPGLGDIQPLVRSGWHRSLRKSLMISAVPNKQVGPGPAPRMAGASDRIPGHARVLVVVNPKSGGGRGQTLAGPVADELRRAGFEIDECETTGHQTLGPQVRTALDRGCSLVVVVGGDGAVTRAVDGLVGTGVPLAIVPAGTANLVARELGIPLDVRAACRLICETHRTIAVDAVRVGDRAFLSHVSMGVYSVMAERIKRRHKRWFGRFAYGGALLAAAVRGRRWKFEITIDGHSECFVASQVTLANVGVVGMSGLRWGPGISPTDGIVDVCIVKARTMRQYARLLWLARRGRLGDGPLIEYRRARESVVVDTSAAVPVRGDGKIVGESRLDARIVPGGVRVVVPVES